MKAPVARHPLPQGGEGKKFTRRRQVAKAPNYKFPVFFATFATWRLCENMFSHFGRFFHAFGRPRYEYSGEVNSPLRLDGFLRALLVPHHIDQREGHKLRAVDHGPAPDGARLVQ